MKRFLAILIFLCVFASLRLSALTLTNSINGHVTLLWGYDAEPANTNLAFDIYCTTNVALPANQWPLLTNVPSTAALNTNDASGTNYQLTLDVQPAQYFFTAVATNFWGEASLNSNIASTPPPPQPVTSLAIRKIP